MDFRAGRRRSRILDLNITPLVDMVFNLLMFFLVTTTFAQAPAIDVDLPEAAAPEQPADSVLIAISAGGELVYEGRSLDLAALETALRERRLQRPAAVVVLHADARTAHGRVVTVMDLCRRVGFNELAVATDEPR